MSGYFDAKTSTSKSISEYQQTDGSNNYIIYTLLDSSPKIWDIYLELEPRIKFFSKNISVVRIFLNIQ